MSVFFPDRLSQMTDRPSERALSPFDGTAGPFDHEAVARAIRTARTDTPQTRHLLALTETSMDIGGAVDFYRCCSCGWVSKPHTRSVAADLERCPVLAAERERTANAKAYGHRVNLGLMGLVK